MQDYIGYKIKLYPTTEQINLIKKFAGASRYAYNWALSTQIKNYDEGNKYISGYNLTKLFTQHKKEEDKEWLYDISNACLKQSILDLDKAYQNFFKGITKFPKFKIKKGNKLNFPTRYDRLTITKDYVKCEKLGKIKCGYHRIDLSKANKYANPRISYDGNNYWLSVNVLEEIKENNNDKTEPIGIDLGIKTLAICSNGKEYHRVNTQRKNKRLKKLQRKANKKYDKMIKISKETKTKFKDIPKSKNLIKLEYKINKLHNRITNIRKSNIHFITSDIIKQNPNKIVIEDLNVSGMMKNHRLAKQIADCSFYEFKRQLEYKCKWNNIELIIADRFYPSSKLCSNCGNKKDNLKLSDRVYKCNCCGLTLDRDYNASLNLKKLAI